jgi:hypothetical protein
MDRNSAQLHGLLHYINGTGKAFAELESAIQFAEENPAE